MRSEKTELENAKFNLNEHIQMKREQRKFTNEFNAEVASEAIREKLTF
jgi:hypothetical protein